MNITPENRASLLQMLHSPGWQVALDLGNEQCELLVTDLLKASGFHRDEVCAKHLGARYARAFFDEFCTKIEVEAKKTLTPEKSKPLDPDFIAEVSAAVPDSLPIDYIPEDWQQAIQRRNQI